ncbi:hypothetical protein ACTID9_22815 [Brevibacillus fluminis]|uniref:hypothetical protein n=1 Tax=Brevibacillus fluminis TaxID=511487 RepID=UPI003F8A34E4
MRRWRIPYTVSLVVALLILFGCSYAVSSTKTQTVPLMHAGIQADSPFHTAEDSPKDEQTAARTSDELIASLAAGQLQFAYVSLDSAVTHYLKGEPIVIVAGSVDAQNRAWVLVTQPDMVRSEPAAIGEAVRDFQAHSKQLAHKPLTLSEESITQALQAEASLPQAKKMNISWLIDRSFVAEQTTN